MGPPEPDAQYELVCVTDGDWLREHFKSERLEGGDVLVKGPCRRCGHEVHMRKAVRTVRAFEAAPSSKPMAMKCNCAAEHAGGEPGDGCGAWWGVSLKRRR